MQPRAQAQTPELQITELMASNQQTVRDEDDDASDWIEIHNGGSSTVNLQGYTLTDDAEVLNKWTFPSLALAPDQYLLVFASAKNRASAGAELHTNFRLRASGEYVALADPAGNVVSEFAPQYPALAADVSYGIDADGEIGFLGTASPGFPNGFVGSRSLSVSPSSQLFSGSLQVELNSQIAGAIIRYTTDGSTPTASSMSYSTPIAITTQTILKAQAFFPSGTTSAVETQRYILMQGDVVNFSSNLPLVVIDTFSQTVEQENRIGVFTQFFDADETGRAALSQPAQTATYAGFNIRGALSSTWDKKQYALEAWDENEDEVDVAPLGLPPEADWILNGPYADKTLMKNALVFGWWNEMGRYASRTRFVEVYLNTDDALTQDDYIGVYVLLERIKRDANRVDVETLSPTDNAPPSVDGGYIWKVDDFELDGERVGFVSSQVNPNCLAYFNVYPRFENITPEQQSALQGIVDEYDDALFGAGFADPAAGYANYIDVDSFIDYGIMQDFTQNTDGYHRSIFFYKPRAGKVAMGPLWDFNFSLGVDNRGLGAPDQPVTDREGGACWYRTFPRLFEDPEFEIKYWDRWFELRETVLERGKLMAEINANAAMLDEAQARNFARWDVLNVDIRDVTLPGSYAGAIAILKDWVTERLIWFDSQWINPPVFNQEGGSAAAGFQLTMSSPPNIAGEIYFTFDGRDPRAVGGGIAPSAQRYVSPVALTATTRVKARVKVATGWSALNHEVFNIDAPAAAGSLVITELHTHPYAASEDEAVAGYADADSFEFVELQNVSTNVIDVSDVQVRDAITFDFADSDYLVLQPGERVLLVEDSNAFALRYGSNLPIGGEYSGKLSNVGETITVLGQNGATIEELVFANGRDWPNRAAGRGSSLVRIAAAVSGNRADNWRASVRFGGTPGAISELSAKTVLLNEILAHSDPPLSDMFELYNATANAIDISNWYLSDNNQNYQKFRIPAGTNLPAGGFIVFDESNFNPPAAPDGFALNSSRGDEVYLVAGNEDGKLVRFVDQVTFGATVTDESIGRWPDGADQLYPMQARTFGSANTSNQNQVRVGPVVLNEIHFNPAGDDENLEYIELLNSGETAQPLDNWRVRGQVEFDFPTNITLLAGEALILVGFDPTDQTLAENFRNRWYDFGNITMLGPWRNSLQLGGTLGNSGGTIELQRAEARVWPTNGVSPYYPMVEEDTVRYTDNEPWPVAADSGGPALERISPAVYGDDPANWQASSLSGGTPGVQLAPAILVSAAPEPLITDESGRLATFTTMLQSPPRAEVKIPLLVSDSTEGTVSPSALIFNSANWDQPQIVLVTGVADSLADGDKPYQIRTMPAVSSDPAYDSFNAADVSFINLDDVGTTSTPTTTTSTATPIATSTATSTTTSTPTPTTANTPTPTTQATATLVAEITPTATSTPTPTLDGNVSALDIALLDDGAAIMWTFTADQQTLWFNIYRSTTNGFDDAQLISLDFIPSHFAGTQNYQFEDKTLSENGAYHYWVEQVFGGGNSALFGPIGPVSFRSTTIMSFVYLPVMQGQ